MFFVFFFFKQKTAYEMRISDWSSDVCSSDLAEILRKLEESRLRNLTEQQRLAEEDKRRVEEAAERKRKEEEEAERLRVEAEMAAAAAAVSPEDEAAPRKPHGHGARKRGVEGKRGAVRLDIGVRRIINKKKRR